jgi:sialate O-acetylesterase
MKYRLGLLALLLCGGAALGDVRLPAVFSDHMVLQQGIPVPVWGWADDGESVTVHFRNQDVTATAQSGKWMVRLKRLKTGGPDVMTIAGKNRIELKDVLVGEVWICSGQSNMELRLKQSYQPENDIASSANPKIRLLTVEKVRSDRPLDDVKGTWRECGPDSVPDFSAVAYYFGRSLQKARNAPVGLIHTSWGGSPAEVWMSDKALKARPEYSSIFDSYSQAWKRYEAEKERFEQSRKNPEATANTPAPRAPRAPWRPSELYNAMIRPLIPYAVKGAIWYQGEANAGRARQYRTLFPDLIRNWRNDWQEGDFTFLLVQLAPWDKDKKRSLEQIAATPVESDWAELREAQLLTTKTVPYVGMAVITDIGEKDDIHPKKKQPVGERLALAARAIAYREKLVSSGPVFKKMTVKGNESILKFDNAGPGLEARGGELQGFAICGPDKKFVWAKARINGKQVIVSSPAVSQPVAVRYGWADFPIVNLWNRSGLPASPFRTDDFPMITK